MDNVIVMMLCLTFAMGYELMVVAASTRQQSSFRTIAHVCSYLVFRMFE